MITEETHNQNLSEHRRVNLRESLFRVSFSGVIRNRRGGGHYLSSTNSTLRHGPPVPK